MCLCELAILALLLFLRAASVRCCRAAVELTTTGCVLCRAVPFYHINKWTVGSFYGMPLILTCTRATKQMVVINLFYPNSVVATFYENVEIAGKGGGVNTKCFFHPRYFSISSPVPSLCFFKRKIVKAHSPPMYCHVSGLSRCFPSFDDVTSRQIFLLSQ